MDEAEQALAYAEADFSEANTLFIDLFAALKPHGFAGRTLDLGCGPADIPLRLARRWPGARIDAVDGAATMLDLADAAIRTAGLEERITLRCHHLPAADLPKSHYDAVLSNSLLHHLQDPGDLWRAVRRCARPGAAVLVMDLLRPDSVHSVERLVELYAGDAPAVLRRDFEASLRAAYTLDEVRTQLAESGLEALSASQVSDRHLAVQGHLS